MNSKVWWILLVVVIVILAIVMMARGGDSSPEVPYGDEVAENGDTPTNINGAPNPAGGTKPERTAEGYMIIRYTNSGFQPSSLEVAKGESIRFINDSNAALSIAPADSVNQPYATFDQSKSIGKGMSYDYTFTTIGSYTYYNLNNKTHVGTVVAK
jgi:plastocyanin